MPRARPRPPAEKPAEDALGAIAWARYRDNLARHLIGIARDLQIRLMTQLADVRGHRALRPSFGLPISLIAQAPRPLSELARALEISPQAASQLVGLAERAGYLDRRDVPGDRRARVAVLTPAGQQLVVDAVACLRELEAEQSERVGAAEHRRFVAALAVLADGFFTGAFPGAHGPGRVADANGARRGAPRSIGLLPLVAAEIERRLMAATSERGHAGLKLSHGQILTLVGTSGARLHQLALLHRVSRQAISATAQDLERLGYLRREPDPSDRRGIVVRLTAKGTRLIEDSVRALEALDDRFRERLGSAEFDALERVARRLYATLELETGLLSAAFPVTGAGAQTAGASLATDRAGRADAFEGFGRLEPGSGSARRPGGSTPADLARIAALLRDHLGSHDAERLALHLRSP